MALALYRKKQEQQRLEAAGGAGASQGKKKKGGLKRSGNDAAGVNKIVIDKVDVMLGNLNQARFSTFLHISKMQRCAAIALILILPLRFFDS